MAPAGGDDLGEMEISARSLHCVGDGLEMEGPMQEWPSVVSTVSSVVGGGATCGVMHCQCDGAFLLLFWIVSRVRRGGRAGGCETGSCVGPPGSKAWLGPDNDKRAAVNSTLNIDSCRLLSRVHLFQRRLSPTLPEQINFRFCRNKKAVQKSHPTNGHSHLVVKSQSAHCPGEAPGPSPPAFLQPGPTGRAWIGQGKGARQRHRADTLDGNAHQNSRAEAPARSRTCTSFEKTEKTPSLHI